MFPFNLSALKCKNNLLRHRNFCANETTISMNNFNSMINYY